MSSDKKRENSCKLKEGRFRLHIRKKFFPMRVVKHWGRLPRAAVAAPSLAVFKARLDGALSTLGWWKMSLLMAGRLEPDDLSGPFQPLPFHDPGLVFVFLSIHFIPACMLKLKRRLTADTVPFVV